MEIVQWKIFSSIYIKELKKLPKLALFNCKENVELFDIELLLAQKYCIYIETLSLPGKICTVQVFARREWPKIEEGPLFFNIRLCFCSFIQKTVHFSGMLRQAIDTEELLRSSISKFLFCFM